MSLLKARELRQDRKKAMEDAKAAVAQAETEGRSLLDSEEQEKWDRAMKDFDRLGEEIETIESREYAMIEAAGKLAEDQRQTDDSSGDEARTDEYREAFRNYLVYGENQMPQDQRSVLEEQRALQGQTSGTNAQGGFTVPTEFDARLVEALKAFGGIRQAATNITTSDGRNLQVPVSDDTGNTAILIAEATGGSTSVRVTFGQKTLEAHMYTSGPIKISRELLQDSALDIEGVVRNALVTRFGRRWNNHFTLRSSTESAGPDGIVNDSTGGTIAADLASVTIEKLIDLEANVDPAYRQGASFMFNDAARVSFRKFREGNSGAFLWEPGLQNGGPDRLMGYPIIINQDLASFGTSGNKPIWFGDFSHYWVRDVAGIQIARLEERYAEEGVVAILGYARVDGRSVFGSTAPAQKPYRCIVQSTG